MEIKYGPGNNLLNIVAGYTLGKAMTYLDGRINGQKEEQQLSSLLSDTFGSSVAAEKEKQYQSSGVIPSADVQALEENIRRRMVLSNNVLSERDSWFVEEIKARARKEKQLKTMQDSLAIAANLSSNPRTPPRIRERVAESQRALATFLDKPEYTDADIRQYLFELDISGINQFLTEQLALYGKYYPEQSKPCNP